MKKIYFDNNSTTPLDPEVIKVIEEELLNFGNPSSIHAFGQEIKTKLIQARRSIAHCLGVSPTEIIFASGGTEGINMAIRGLIGSSFHGEIITSSVEHACVYQTCQKMQEVGCSIVELPVGNEGRIHLKDLQSALHAGTRLIVLIGANNETGVLNDIEAIAQIAQRAKIPLILDGVALLGKEKFQIPRGVSIACFSGHKIHALKGIGFSVIRKFTACASLITGGPQEQERRGGTENVLGILSLAKAIEIMTDKLEANVNGMRKLRDHFEKRVSDEIEGVVRNGAAERVSNTSNLSFLGIDGDAFLMNLDLAGIAVSSGSACSSGALEPSRVLLNMGLSRETAKTSVRFTFSRMNTMEEVDAVCNLLPKMINRLRSLS